MSEAASRLWNLLGHLRSFTGTESPVGYEHSNHLHNLSPTSFLERSAAIEPDAKAIHHVTANGKVLTRSYADFAQRARGLAYFLVKHRLKRVGILATNTPAFLESIFGIVAGGGVIVPVNYRLKADDVTYIFDFAQVDSIIVDAEYISLLDDFKKSHPNVRLIVDLVSHKCPHLRFAFSVGQFTGRRPDMSARIPTSKRDQTVESSTRPC